MTDSQKVVYAAKNMQQAYLLKNSLVEMGIPAEVINANLESGSGVDYVGWNTLARVVVEESDYETARRIALDFDRTGADAAARDDQQLSAQQDEPVVEEHAVHSDWPCCPNCHAPRITKCPVCKTTGDDFPQADPEFVWGMGLDEVHDGNIPQDDDENAPDRQNDDDGNETIVLMCPICDEPFLPEFPNRCAMCGHRFADGFDVEPQAAAPEEIGSRVIALLVGLAVLTILVLSYFIWLVY